LTSLGRRVVVVAARHARPAVRAAPARTVPS
jgi:hypothetical protein